MKKQSQNLSQLEEEGLEFYKMKKAEDQSRFPSANTVTYVVSTDWIEKYKEYIFWQSFN